MQVSGQLHALVISLQGRKGVGVHVVGCLLVIINRYYGFYFPVLLKVQTQRLCYKVVLLDQFSLP